MLQFLDMYGILFLKKRGERGMTMAQMTKMQQRIYDYIAETIQRQGYPPSVREIGEAVRHSTRTVYLDYDFGIPLCYFAEMAGMYWPETQVMADAEMAGAGAGLFDQQLSAPERFDLFYRGKKPDYFIVFRAVQEMKLQPGLNDFLFGNYPVLVYSPRYIVFDLRKPLKP